MSKCEVDTTAFNRMCQQGARLSATPHSKFLRHEVGRVMEAAVKFTPAIRVNEARLRHETAIISAQHSTMYTPRTASGARNRAGRVKLTKNGYIKYWLGNRYPAALWAEMSRRRRDRLARIIGARGLAKKSWYRIMLALGVEIKVPAFVKSARPSKASAFSDYQDVTVRVHSSDAKLTIHTVNAQPTVNYPNVRGADALRRAIAGRVKFFEQNIKHLVFNDLARIARAYPGLKITVPPKAD